LIQALRYRCCLSLTEAIACIEMHREARRQGQDRADGGPEAVARIGGPTQAIRNALDARARWAVFKRSRAALGVMEVR